MTALQEVCTGGENIIILFLVSAAQTLTGKCKSLHDASDLKLYDLVFLEPNPASGLQIP